MNKTNIRNFAIWARRKLISDITYKAGMIGITENGVADKLPQSTADLHFFDIGTKNYSEVSGVEIKQRDALINAIREREHSFKSFKEAFNNTVEEVAYTWFNRLIAIRFMEVNEYLPSGVRVLSSENKSKNEPDFVTLPFDTDLDFTPYEQDRVFQLKDGNKLDELFRMLFIKQCNKLNSILPDLFEKTDDYTELLLTISFTDKDGVVYRLVHDIEEEDFDVEKEGQIEIIGWLYQYYNSELKDDTFAKLKKNIKIEKDRVPAATQLFTPDWIVRYMVENSLGRLWLDGHSTGTLKSNWKYYLDEAEQEEDVKRQLEAIRKEYAGLNPEKISFIDPCMGSGHILVYAFDIFMQIYESCGYTPREAAISILSNNIYGLDIDKRAYQLSYFALMMKARQYNRRIFNEGIKPNVFYIRDNSHLTSVLIDHIANGNPKIKSDLNSIADDLKDATEYGSLVSVTPVDFDAIYKRLDELKKGEIDLFSVDINEHIMPVIRQAEALSQKYDVVCTNPPYMGAGNMNAKLSDYVKKNFPDEKADLFACFISRGNTFVKQGGFNCMVTMQSWMFLSSFEAMRTKLLASRTITNLMHMENMVLGIAFGTAVTVFENSYIEGYKGTYNHIKLSDIEKGKPKTFPVQGNRFAQISTENFSKIPGSPVAYWAKESIINAFEKEMLIDNISEVKIGMGTGKNEVFVRQWWEVKFPKIDFSLCSISDLDKSVGKWFPYNKGGEYRLWYGNLQEILWFDKQGRAKMNTMSGHRENGGMNYYFRKGITWTFISSSNFGVRHRPFGSLFDVAGSTLFTSDEYYNYILAFLSSNVCNYILKLLNPTLNYQAGNIKSLPIIFGEKEKVENLAKDNVSMSKDDWDSFETSWDFKAHPLVRSGKWKVESEKSNHSPLPTIHSPLSTHYAQWQSECQRRFEQLKKNEEELNRIFIDIYGLQDELTPEVDDKDVTVRKADLQRDIRSFISYAVGCMFGRYSLDEDGLILAGQDFGSVYAKNPQGYSFGDVVTLSGNYIHQRDGDAYHWQECSFFPDEDNCIPITDDEYFTDDIVGRFVEFVKVVYGDESLEDNLRFIANALGNKGGTSREVIRNYFLNDFYADHLKIYQKRPIYWLFDSGKKNGFKALVYMHRWNADTTGNMRVEYLHRMQRVYEKEIERMQEAIENSHDNKEISNAVKRQEKLRNQLKETKDYDALVAHLALSRIDIDLDDGVKTNYEKVQTASDGRKVQVLAKI